MNIPWRRSRGAAATTTWTFRGDGVAATPRLRRGNLVETGARLRYWSINYLDVYETSEDEPREAAAARRAAAAAEAEAAAARKRAEAEAAAAKEKAEAGGISWLCQVGPKSIGLCPNISNVAPGVDDGSSNFIYTAYFGRSPMLRLDDAKATQWCNGGIPQLANKTLHFEKVTEDLDAQLHVDYAGLIVLDWEDWWPAWNATLSEAYRNASRALARTLLPAGATAAAVEAKAMADFDAASVGWFADTTNEVKRQRPHAQVGWYAGCVGAGGAYVCRADTGRGDAATWLAPGETVRIKVVLTPTARHFFSPSCRGRFFSPVVTHSSSPPPGAVTNHRNHFHGTEAPPFSVVFRAAAAAPRRVGHTGITIITRTNKKWHRCPKHNAFEAASLDDHTDPPRKLDLPIFSDHVERCLGRF